MNSVAREDFQTALAHFGKAIVEAPDSHLAKCLAGRGYAYLCMQQYERALSDCDESIKLDPMNGQAIAWRGSALAGLSRWREAIEDLNLAIELCPENAMEYEQVGLSHSENAILDFRQRVKSGDGSCQLFHDRGVIYAFRGELDKAIRDFTQAIEADHSHASSYFGRAECLAEVGRSDEALCDCNAAVELGFDQNDVLRLRSVLAEKHNDLSLALGDLNSLLEREPNDTESLRRRAQVYARQQKFDGAHRAYTRLLERDESHSDVFVARGIVRCELGDYWGAIDDFSRSLDKVPGDAETLALRGEAKLSLTRTKQALEDFDAAIELNSACTSARRGRALVYSACGRHDQALTLLVKTLRLDPRYGLGFAAKGRILQEQKRFEEAIEAFNQALGIIGDGRGAADAYYRRGVCLAAGEQWKEAASDFDEAIRRRQTHAGSLLWRANVKFKNGNWKSALDDLTAAIELNPTDAPHYRKLAEAACQNVIDRLSKSISAEPTAGRFRDRGIARYFIGQSESALDDLNAAIEQDPADVIARIHRAKLLRDSGHAKSALADYEAVIEIKSGDATYLLGRAACWVELVDFKKALADVSSAIRFDPRSSNAYLLRAKILARHGKAGSAMSDLGQAIGFAPQRPEAYLERAKIRAAQKHYLAAIVDLDSATERDSRLNEAVMLRAELLSRVGQNERALADFEAAIRSGHSVQAHCGRALSLARLGKHDVALRELTKVIRLFESADLATLLGCRAKIAYNAGQFRRAQSDFEIALATGSATQQQSAQLAYGQGLAMFQLDDSSGAKGAIRQAIDLDATCLAAVAVLDWLDGKTTEKPGQLDPPRTKVKLQAPPRIRPSVPGIQADGEWDTVPPWNLWLVTSSDTGSDAEFGPVEKTVLDQWCQQGRIGEHTLLLRADWDEWKWASDVFPQLGVSEGSVPRKKSSVSSKEPDSGEAISFPEIQV